jgi:hypothetical protein
LLERAAAVRPEGVDFGNDAIAQLVAGPGEREGDMRMQALELLGAR